MHALLFHAVAPNSLPPVATFLLLLRTLLIMDLRFGHTPFWFSDTSSADRFTFLISQILLDTLAAVRFRLSFATHASTSHCTFCSVPAARRSPLCAVYAASLLLLPVCTWWFTFTPRFRDLTRTLRLSSLHGLAAPAYHPPAGLSCVYQFLCLLPHLFCLLGCGSCTATRCFCTPSLLHLHNMHTAGFHFHWFLFLSGLPFSLMPVDTYCLDRFSPPYRWVYTHCTLRTVLWTLLDTHVSLHWTPVVHATHLLRLRSTRTFACLPSYTICTAPGRTRALPHLFLHVPTYCSPGHLSSFLLIPSCHLSARHHTGCCFGFFHSFSLWTLPAGSMRHHGLVASAVLWTWTSTPFGLVHYIPWVLTHRMPQLFLFLCLFPLHIIFYMHWICDTLLLYTFPHRHSHSLFSFCRFLNMDTMIYRFSSQFTLQFCLFLPHGHTSGPASFS